MNTTAVSLVLVWIFCTSWMQWILHESTPEESYRLFWALSFIRLFVTAWISIIAIKGQ